jgi:excisionase family DNA binding protein
MSDKPLITYQEAARILGLPRGTLYALVHQNRIPHIRLGKRLVRFDENRLREFVDAHRVEAAFSNGADA